jgi:hypothetical protein
MFALVALALDDNKIHEPALAIRQSHYFAVASAPCFAHRLCLCAANWIGSALMCNDMTAIYQHDTAADLASKALEQDQPKSASSEGAMSPINRLPRAILRGHVAPGAAITKTIEQGIEHQVHLSHGPAAIFYDTNFFKRRCLSGPHH